MRTLLHLDSRPTDADHQHPARLADHFVVQMDPDDGVGPAPRAACSSSRKAMSRAFFSSPSWAADRPPMTSRMLAKNRLHHGCALQFKMSRMGALPVSRSTMFIRNRRPSADTTYVPLGKAGKKRPTRVVKSGTGVPMVTGWPFAAAWIGAAMSFPSSPM